MQLDHLWKAERWDPAALMDLYVRAGAKYFVALANHHDNFDAYESTHHAWNSVRIGPKRDIVGKWARLARERGLRFGVTNHSAHAWHWFQTAYGYDPEGDRAGVRYDAFRLRAKDGTGQWWDGLDPQELYTGPNIVMPDGIRTMADANAWHEQHDCKWTEAPPPENPEFVRRWFLRCQELVDKYQPDLLYFDDTELPLAQAGLDIAAHFYNANIGQRGVLEAVLTSKGLQPDHAGAMVLDIERGRADRILPAAWQTDTCIGDWHYRRETFEQHKYKSAETVIRMLVDIVSKNGNLLLNIPLRGDGTIDDDERTVLAGLAAWMPAQWRSHLRHAPVHRVRRGPPGCERVGQLQREYVATVHRGRHPVHNEGRHALRLCARWPATGILSIKTLAQGSVHYPREIGRVELLGGQGGPLRVARDTTALRVTLPERHAGDTIVTLKIASV